jgi:hypothetical protein
LVGRGDVPGIQKLHHDDPEKLYETDANGWSGEKESFL